MVCITRFLLLSIFCWASLSGIAQPYPSRLGKFQVLEKKGCAPLTVTFQTLLPGGCGTNPCAIDFLGDGFVTSQPDHASTTPASFVFTVPGIYTMKVCYSNMCSPSDVDDIQIEVMPNTIPAFDAYTCSGNAVLVTIKETTYNQYVISYSDGSTVTVPSGSLAKDIHTFASPGSKTISVRGRYLNAANNCLSSPPKLFTAVASLPIPSLSTLTNLDESRIEVTYALPPNLLGRLDIANNNATTFQQVKSIYNEALHSVEEVNTVNNYYCFRIGAIDGCTSSTTFSTNIVCTMRLTATAKDGFNQLDWITNPAGIASLNLNRDESPYVNGIPPVPQTRNDNDAICNTQHCYQIVANYGGGATSTSLKSCVNSFTTEKPAVITDLTASIQSATSLALEWPSVLEAVEYSIFRNSNGGSFTSLDRGTATNFDDFSFSLPAKYCYEVISKNDCNNSSDISSIACPVILEGKTEQDNSFALTWSTYQGWQNGVSQYRLEKFSQSGNLLRTINLGLATTYLDTESDIINQVARYKITALAVSTGLPNAESNTIELIKKPNLYYPTAFTPDKKGPSENEIFRVYGQYIETFEMKIFNRWGELMYTANSLSDGWDGTFRGEEQPDGTYSFIATIKDFAGRTTQRSGSIVLLRKK